jgi:hypothetical protein
MASEKDIIQKFSAHYEKQEVEQLVNLFTEDATYHDTFYGAFTGHDKIKGIIRQLTPKRREPINYRTFFSLGVCFFGYLGLGAAPASAKAISRQIRSPSCHSVRLARCSGLGQASSTQLCSAHGKKTMLLFDPCG